MLPIVRFKIFQELQNSLLHDLFHKDFIPIKLKELNSLLLHIESKQFLTEFNEVNELDLICKCRK